MKREIRKELNETIKALNDRLPSKKHGFRRILEVALVKNTLEIHEKIYDDKGKIESTKTVLTAMQPENRTHYTWEDMISAGLACANIPIFIFTEFQKEQENSFKERVLSKQNEIEDAEIVEEIN